jgi:ankyrin repeat protein/serine/threonine protein kinase
MSSKNRKQKKNKKGKENTGSGGRSKACFEAVRSNDITAVEAIVQEGLTDLNHYEEGTFGGETVLMVASQLGFLEVVHVLLDAGADVSRVGSKWQETALQAASLHGHGDIVRVLIGAGADLYFQNDWGHTAVTQAAKGGHLEIVQYLLSVGCESDLHFVSCKGRTLVMVASDAGHLHIVQYLVASGADISRRCHRLYTALILAASSGHTEVVQYLLEQGGDVTARTHDGEDALMQASYNGRLETVRVLLRAGGDVSSRNDAHQSALTMAVEEEETAVAEELLAWMVQNHRAHSNMDLLTAKSDGKTAFMLALEKEQRSLVEKMVLYCLPLLRQSDGSVRVVPPEEHQFTWLQVLQDSYIEVVQHLLVQYHDVAHILANSRDALNRRAIDLAEPLCRAAFHRHMYFCEIYQFDKNTPEHRSATSVVYIATMIDAGSGGYGTSGGCKVALKCMKHREQFERECHVREKYALSDEYTLLLMAQYNSDDDEYFFSQLTFHHLESYPYMLVMPAADRSLQSVLAHEHIAGNANMTEQIQTIARQTLRCVAHLHDKAIVHGDLKPLNVMRCGAAMKLIDFDASSMYTPLGIDGLLMDESCMVSDTSVCACKGEVDSQHHCVGSKFSSAYMPPEMVHVEHDKCGDLRATCCGDEFLVPAAPSFDVWSVGMILYELCVGETLFHANGQDNIDEEQLLALYHWTDEFKQKRLNKIKDKVARNLISQLLSKDPSKRLPVTRVLAHPFITGKPFTRLVGQAPLYDVFLSYRVATDQCHARELYRLLTDVHHLKVFWDVVSLQPGVPWDEGFCDGLVQSRVFVPLLSRGALKTLPDITAEAPCDNVLLEYRLAQEFRGLGLLEFVFPVFIGDCDSSKDSSDGRGESGSECYSDYFQSGCHPALSSAGGGKREKEEEGEGGASRGGSVVVRSIEGQVTRQLERLSLGAPLQSQVDVRSTVASVTSNQGSFIKGKYGEALDFTAETLRNMVGCVRGEEGGNHHHHSNDSTKYDIVMGGRDKQFLVDENCRLVQKQNKLLEEIFRLTGKHFDV